MHTHLIAPLTESIVVKNDWSKTLMRGLLFGMALLPLAATALLLIR